MKRTPLERKSELQRKTPLRAGKVPERVVAQGALERTRSARHREPQSPKRQPSNGVPAKIRAALKARSGGLCEIAAPGCLEIATDDSHRIKKGMGGRKGQAAVRHNVLSNLLHACRRCHADWLHAQPEAAYAQGWMLREHQNPITEPVVYRGHWCLLDDDGLVHPITQDLEEEAA